MDILNKINKYHVRYFHQIKPESLFFVWPCHAVDFLRTSHLHFESAQCGLPASDEFPLSCIVAAHAWCDEGVN
jgi:hypothetical protein